MPIKFDGLDDAIIGVTASDNKIVYNADRILTLLCEQSDMSEEDALEFMEFNIIGLYAGEGTPIIVWLDDPEQVLEYVSTIPED
jgi:limonene-1,2-epoxide hydrolase